MMDWASAWQLAGEIVDRLADEKTLFTARQQEEIADQIHKRSGYKFDGHSQKWVTK